MHLIWEWWGAMYGNVFAISVWTVILFAWHHLTLKRHITAKHEELKAHITATGQPPGDDLSSGNEEDS